MLHQEKRLYFSKRHSILTTQINAKQNSTGSHGFVDFMFLQVNFSKVLRSAKTSSSKTQMRLSSREEYIPQILTVLLLIHHVYIRPLWPFVFRLSFVKRR